MHRKKNMKTIKDRHKKDTNDVQREKPVSDKKGP